MGNLNWCLITAFAYLAVCAWADGLHIESRISQVYFERETPSFDVTGVDGTFQWWIENWRGEKVREGDGVSGTPVKVSGLPPGFWRFEVADGASLPFSVLVEPSTRRAVKSSPYGIDAALSWVAAPKSFYRPVAENSYYYVADLLKAAGVVATRERMSVAEVYGRDGKTYSWGKYLDNARYQKKQGIRMSGMFQNLPPWMEQKEHKGRFDLVKIRDFCRKCAETFGDAMDDWEFLNEEEGHRSPWMYAAMAKAASIGFHAANPDLVFASMGISTSVDGPWHATLAENGLLPYIGVYNYHTYVTLDKYEAGHSRVRNYLKRNGFADMPILISENGTYIEGSATVPTAKEKYMAHSPEQEIMVADFIPKSFICRQFAGIWRTYYFTFPPFNEGGGKKDWGVLRRDGSAKPGIAAISTITSELQGLECLGRLDLGAGVSAYLYQDGDDSKQVIAFWSEDGKKTISVKSVVPAWLVDWCGTPRELKSGDLSLPAEQHISYLHGAFGLPVAEKPHPVGKPRPYAFAADQEPDVVVVAYFDEDDFSETDSRTAVAAQVGSKWRATVEVWNLSEQPKKGRLVMADAVKAVGVPEEIEIPAGSVVSLPVTLRSEGGADGWAWLRIHGEFDGRRTSPFAVRILDSGKLLANCLKVDGKCGAPEDWEKNTSADRRSAEADGEGGIRFSYFWDKQFANKWFYPRMPVPEQARKTLEYVEYEIKSSQDRPENSYLTANIYCVMEKDRKVQVKSVPPSKVWEKRIVHVMRPEDGSPIVKVEIGGNPHGQEVEYHIRNVRFYYRH